MRFIRFALWPMVLAWLIAGCATPPKINWEARLGIYSYDQAVQELGVPDKSAKLGDGTMVVEWLRRSYSPGVIAYGGGDYLAEPDWVAPQVETVYPGGPEAGQWLRLIFGPDGKLRSWKRFHR